LQGAIDDDDEFALQLGVAMAIGLRARAGDWTSNGIDRLLTSVLHSSAPIDRLKRIMSKLQPHRHALVVVEDQFDWHWVGQAGKAAVRAYKDGDSMRFHVMSGVAIGFAGDLVTDHLWRGYHYARYEARLEYVLRQIVRNRDMKLYRGLIMICQEKTTLVEPTSLSPKFDYDYHRWLRRL